MSDKQTLQDEVSHWISREREGEHLEENKLFNSWIKKDENKTAFKKEQDFFFELTSLPKSFKKAFKEDLEISKKIENKRKTFLLSFISLSSAACILFLVYFSFFTSDITFSKNYMASNKIQTDIVLPDTSIISLDANTSIKVKFYDNKRVVFLSQGKAFFEIAHNKEKPFIVKTQHIDIKVLGTKFEVINTTNFQVNVKEGKVRVANKKDTLLALILKEKSLHLDKNFHISSLNNIDSKTMALWTKGQFNFKQEPLKNVIAEFLKYENIKVIIKDKSLEELPISGKFSSKEFDKVISSLPLIHPVSISKKQDGTIIMRKK